MSQDGQILEIATPLFIYRSRPGSAMTQTVSESRLASQYRLIQQLITRLPQIENATLKRCLIQVISLNCRHLVQTITHYPELERYRYFITDEVNDFMPYTPIDFLF